MEETKAETESRRSGNIKLSKEQIERILLRIPDNIQVVKYVSDSQDSVYDHTRYLQRLDSKRFFRFLEIGSGYDGFKLVYGVSFLVGEIQNKYTIDFIAVKSEFRVGISPEMETRYKDFKKSPAIKICKKYAEKLLHKLVKNAVKESLD